MTVSHPGTPHANSDAHSSRADRAGGRLRHRATVPPSDGASPPRLPDRATLDAEVARAMQATGARDLAVAVIDDGRVLTTAAYGERNADGDPLQPETVMYGASLTKTVFAHLVLQLVDAGVLALDTPIDRLLAQPLPDHPAERGYADWSALADDPRWRSITPRMLLTHSPGFANFGRLEPDGRLRIHFTPGSRYAYSGDGYILLQFVLERGLGLDTGRELQQRVFEPLQMHSTSLRWREDFSRNLADGWRADGTPEPHDARSTVRAAGSMDTTIDDLARFAAALISGSLLSADSAQAMTHPQLPITTRTQFPTLQPDVPAAQRGDAIAAGLGVIVFEGPQGPGFSKGGHNDSTGNTLVCVQRGRRCALLLANDVRAEAAFPYLVRAVLGETGVPWRWEYGDLDLWDGTHRDATP